MTVNKGWADVLYVLKILCYLPIIGISFFLNLKGNIE